MIVDSQVHIWAANTPERPWPPGRHQPHRPQPFSKDDLLREMNSAGVSRAVIVPPAWEGEYNDLALEAARLHPDRFAVMGRIDPALPDVRERLASWRGQPGMLGLRFSFVRQRENAEALADGRMDPIWAAAEEAGLPVMLMASFDQMRTIERIAERHCALKLTMDHLGRQFGKKDEEAFADLDKLLALAKFPNVAVKASGMPAYTSDVYPYRRTHPCIQRAYDAFGPKRMFWGTDFTKLPCTYGQALTMFTEEIPWFTSEDKEWIMGRGVCEWLGWETR
jgi:L-fuconolactonase